METTTSLRHRYPGVRNGIRYSIEIGMLMMVACVPGANAGTITTYTYTGNDFTTVGAPYTTSDSINGYFTIASLAPNLVDVAIFPLYYIFADGLQTFNTSLGFPSTFFIWTDASGAITSWNIIIDQTQLTTSINTNIFPTGTEKTN